MKLKWVKRGCLSLRTFVVFVFLQWSFPFVLKKKRKRKWTLQFYTLPNFKKRQIKKRDFSSLIQEPSGYMNQHLVGASPRIKWTYEPTFGGQGWRNNVIIEKLLSHLHGTLKMLGWHVEIPWVSTCYMFFCVVISCRRNELCKCMEHIGVPIPNGRPKGIPRD